MQCLGAKITNTMPATEENVSGYFEDVNIAALNDHILRRAGSSWDRPMERDALAGLEFGRDQEQAAAYLLGQIGDAPVFSVKDPRMCRLLPFWRPVFELMQVDVSVVHVLRHPMAVAQSLQKRGISIDRGLALWLEHVVRAREDVDPAWSHVTIKYEETIFAKLDWQLKATADRFGLSLDRDELISFIHDHMKADLMHERVFDDDQLPLVVRAVRQHVWLESVYGP